MNFENMKNYKKTILIFWLITGIIFVLIHIWNGIYEWIGRLDNFIFAIFNRFISGFIDGIILAIFYIFLRTTTNKWLIIGTIISVLMLLIASYNAPIYNYNLAKERFDGYNYIIKNCWDNPSNICLNRLCSEKKNYGFCEAIKREPDANLPSEFYDWHSYVDNKSPNIMKLFIPNIKDGFEFYSMFGIFSLIILFLPIIIGYLFGKPKKIN